MRVGLLGGSFNPITKGHIDLVKYVLNSKFTIDQVWLLPCYRSISKKKLIGSEHRLEMCRLAIGNEPMYQIKVCDFEIAHKMCGTSATIIDKFYEFAEDNQYYFIIGMDNALDVERWEDYHRTLQLIPFIVVPRQGYTDDGSNLWYTNPPHLFIRSSQPLIREISSSTVRNELKYGCEEEISDHLHDNVRKYIADNSLY